MALSNKFGWLVLTTGNKSELAVGYCTLYGDMAGGFAVIKDVPKTLVYELARYRNTRSAAVIPRASRSTKPPSRRAAPRPDATTTRCRPTRCSTRSWRPTSRRTARVERDRRHWASTQATVERVMRLVDRNEYKRRQAAPGVRITRRAFGRDRRLPITNRYRKG